MVIFQPKSEWHTLKEKYSSVLVVGGAFQDIPLAVNHANIYAHAIVHQGVSIAFDFCDTEDKDLVRFAAELLARIFTLQNVVRRPILLVVEEASEYTPLSTKGRLVEPWIYERMTSRVTKFATQGRALGVMMVLISQRPAQLNFTVRMMCNLSFYGKFHPKDLSDIEEVLSAYKQVKAKTLARQCVIMPHGSWLVITSEQPKIIAIDVKRRTSHGADTPVLSFIAPQTEETKKTFDSLNQTLTDALRREQAEESELERLNRALKEKDDIIEQKDKKIKELDTALAIAGKLKVEMPPSPPSKPVTVTISEGAVVTPPTSTTLPTSNIPHLSARGNVPDAIRELLKTPYCYKRNGLTPDEIMDILKQEAIPFNRHSVQVWLWYSASRGKVRRVREGGIYRYWIG